MNRINAQQVNGRIVLGGERGLSFRPQDVALAAAQSAEVAGLVVGSFFASVTRVIVRLDDRQMVAIAALGHTNVTAGTPGGAVFNRPTLVGEAPP